MKASNFLDDTKASLSQNLAQNEFLSMKLRKLVRIILYRGIGEHEVDLLSSILTASLAKGGGAGGLFLAVLPR
jgi:hypothetical protein